MTGGQRKKSTTIAASNGSNCSQQTSAASQEPEAVALVTDCPDCKKNMCKCCKGPTAVTRLSLRQDKLEWEVDDRVTSSEAKVINIEEFLKVQQDCIQKLGQSQYEVQSKHDEKGKVIVSEVICMVNKRLERPSNGLMFNIPESNSNIK